MYKANKTIIESLSNFIEYCRVEGLTLATQENYKGYLKKFFGWLRSENLENLFPHELQEKHIVDYKKHLLSPTLNRKTGGSLSPNTQHYYLIALRALLGYFGVKSIVSLVPSRITLPKVNKCLKNGICLDSRSVDLILDAPATNNVIGLRDRVILSIIISTGFKVRRICNLNKDCLNELPEDIHPCLNKYLKERVDDIEALFINYSGKKRADRRLTPRSIERIVKHYSEVAGLPKTLTPEALRSAKILSVWNEKVEIKNISWIEAENKIDEKILWLNKNISLLPDSYKSEAFLATLIKCENCISRKIAILIISGRIKASESSLSDFFQNKHLIVSANNISGRHGADWHKKMMTLMANNFHIFIQKKNIVVEPITNYGRADLGYFPNIGKPIYVEVGTVSLFKVWYNLMTMKNCVFFLIPNDDIIIKFET
ncbi:phage integrase N-terminal SAM-like domain-containing protein [Patescibacteria group bacterium]|nr:phage integrase N-terminal SAM-like domain-containing protein [Patescibacteria group bacterium]